MRRFAKWRWRAVAGAVTLGLAASLPLASNGANAEPDKGLSVRLITGDSVSIRTAPNGQYAVTARPTAERNQPLIRRNVGGHQYVMPIDAANQVATGAIDRRLFDLDVLARYGSDVPLLAEYADGTIRRPDSLTNKGIQRVWLDDGTGKPPARQSSPAAETYERKFTLLDRSGEPVANGLGSLFLVNVETGGYTEVPLRSGVGTVELATGEYVIDAVTVTPRSGGGEDVALVADPSFQVDEAGELVLDARKANQVRANSPRQGSFRAQLDVGFGRALGDSAGSTYLSGVGTFQTPDEPSSRRVYAAPTERMPTNEFVGWVDAFWAKPSATPGGTFYDDSPYLYDLVVPWLGRIPDDLTIDVTDDDFAKLRTEYGSKPDGRYGWRWQHPYVRLGGDEGRLVSPTLFIPAVGMALPFEREEYYSTGKLKWSFWFEEYAKDYYPDGKATAASYSSLRSYVAGQTVDEQWNAGVFGPGLPGPAVGAGWNLDDRPFARRDGDRLTFDIPMFSDGRPERSGRAPIRSRVTELRRDGELVGRSKEPYIQAFNVPSKASGYELTTTAKRRSSLHSSSISATWTFESATVPAGRSKALSLLAVRYAPDLDSRSRAPGGQSYDIPITVQGQPGSDTGQPRTLEVQVSYDGGQTWRPAELDRTGPKTWDATVTHPDAGQVSLRASASDVRGNTVEQTVIGAYSLR